jgi:hypothetical protein
MSRHPKQRPNSVNMKRHLTLFCACLASAPIAKAATPAVITFDDLPSIPSPSPSYPQPPAGYHGLEWFNFYVLDALDSPPSGARNGTVSPQNVAFNGSGARAHFRMNGLFDFESVYLTAAWNDGLHMEIRGFVGSTVKYDTVCIVDTFVPTLFTFNFLGVDKVEFYGWGGTPNPEYGRDSTVFALDNLTVVVPEPTVTGLVLFGMALIRVARSIAR